MSSLATTAEKREVRASGLLLLYCAGAQPRLLTAICIHLDVITNAHFPTCALQRTPFLGTKVPFSRIITGNIIRIEKAGIPETSFSTREGAAWVTCQLECQPKKN